MIKLPSLAPLGPTWLKQRKILRETATELYGGVVTQARNPVFYAEMGIPDTLEGRYEMVALHLALVLERLRREGDAGVALSRATIETFVADMDGSMRELGVGDLTVPKKVKSAAAGLYARADAYRQALLQEEGAGAGVAGALDAVIARFALGDATAAGRAAGLARYYRAQTAALARLGATEVLAGRMPMPAPASAIGGGTTT